MPKIIRTKDKQSLYELDWQSGELLAFDNYDFELPLPFTLIIPWVIG
ncbi:hypothetical protein HN832_04920 [archaeon]|jgi:hypothetical protein|nr:hypothetical protein [archaeon]MBT4374030.1 hypothetical protein [archaeon]MBT4532126.1 hypothetical protein [archaeon]MBT7002016.1 hypothetical protein [archaeon]MBT7282727.1 hypothetical protein [archaeon]